MGRTVRSPGRRPLRTLDQVRRRSRVPPPPCRSATGWIRCGCGCRVGALGDRAGASGGAARGAGAGVIDGMLDAGLVVGADGRRSPLTRVRAGDVRVVPPGAARRGAGAVPAGGRPPGRAPWSPTNRTSSPRRRAAAMSPRRRSRDCGGAGHPGARGRAPARPAHRRARAVHGAARGARRLSVAVPRPARTQGVRGGRPVPRGAGAAVYGPQPDREGAGRVGRPGGAGRAERGEPSSWPRHAGTAGARYRLLPSTGQTHQLRVPHARWACRSSGTRCTRW